MNTFLRFKMLKNGENMGNGKISRSGAGAGCTTYRGTKLRCT